MQKIKETIPQKAAPQGRQSLAKLGAFQSEIMMELTREKLTVDLLTLCQKEGFLSVHPAEYNVFDTQFTSGFRILKRRQP